MTRKNGILCALFIVSSITFVACGTFKQERTYSKKGLTVTYRSINRFGSGISNYRLRHPINISREWVKKHLLALWYRKIEPPGKAKPIFLPDQVEDLSPLIVKAFKKIKPGKYLHFEFQSLNGVTSGDVFASVDKIHWRLLKIGGVIYSNDPLRIRKPTWKLVRKLGQAFHKVPTAISLKSQENWILADYHLREIKRGFSSAVKTYKKPTGIKRKLKALKEFFEDGLIDEKEYKKKKKEIIDQNL